ncbi:MAG TPA: OmpA family protein [Polyangiaceae bacterium]|nr:OmpA family protein [Polyangiaceae bacterium]
MKRTFRTSFVSSAIASTLTASLPALADGVALNRFDPAPAGDRMFGVPSPTVAGEAVLRVSALLDYAHNPLVFHSTKQDSKLGSLVESQLHLHLNASLALWNRVAVNALMPLALYQSGENPTVSGQRFESPDRAQAGDLRVGLRVRLFGEFDDPFQLGVGGYVWVPTAPAGDYVGDGKARGMPQLLLGGRVGRVLWSFAAGPQFRSTVLFGGVTSGTQLNVGAGVGVLVDQARRLQIGAESYSAFTLVNKDASTHDNFNRAANVEVLGSVRYRLGDDWEIGGGAGPGFGSGLGTPDVRAVAMVAYSPESKRPPPDRDGDGITDQSDACPDTKGVANADPSKNGCPPDRDSDGIGDAQDACPDVPGVRSDDPSKNGCPPDRDQDGIIDEKDACPDVKGAPNADPNKNGCPPDRDQDGIPDDRDACPDVKGVANPDPQKNGCPPDRDGDGILDDKDACPDERGSADPDPKKNGCPVVHVTDQEIVILEQVQFDFNKAVIKKVSDPLLDKVAAVFKQYPEIKNVEVQGHTDNVGTPVHNRRLSQRRAEAVVEALITRGVPNAKVTPKGYGPDVPIADNSTEQGRQLNRRVQFKILERDPKAAVPQVSDGKTAAPKTNP